MTTKKKPVGERPMIENDAVTAVELQAQFRKEGRWVATETWPVAENDHQGRADAIMRAVETAKVYARTRRARYRVRTVTTHVLFETEEKVWT
jgi:hypothetical protein